MAKFEERKKKWGSEMVFKSISLPANIIEKLKLLQSSYQKSYGRKVSYGEIFERLFSPLGLGNVDPGAYNFFQEELKTRSEFNDVVKRSTVKAVDELVDRAQANGTSLKKEAMKEQKTVKEEMARQTEETKKPIKAQKTAVEAKKEAKPTVEPLKPQKPQIKPEIKENKPKKEEVNREEPQPAVEEEFGSDDDLKNFIAENAKISSAPIYSLKK